MQEKSISSNANDSDMKNDSHASSGTKETNQEQMMKNE